MIVVVHQVPPFNQCGNINKKCIRKNKNEKKMEKLSVS